MRLVQIVPTLPPPTEGVGSYALALARALSDRFGIATRFLVGDPAWHGGAAAEGLATRVAARTAAELLAGLAVAETDTKPSVVLLHYANYGYQERGCPHWLVDGLLGWRAGRPGRRLVTVFHEVYATGPPWRSSFWLSSVQRRLAASLARESDGLVTSLDLYAGLLAREVPGREITVLPVFSTVGEPAGPEPAERSRRLVVFGGPGTRRRAYRERLPDLESACRGLGIEEVLDVGPPVAEVPPEVAGSPVRQTGALAPEEVSALLLGSFAGFLSYPPAFLPKSTVFAAYCAHGLLPICAGRLPAGGNGLPVPAFWTPDAGAEVDFDAVAIRAHAWYEGHRLERQAETFQRLLTGAGNRS